MKTLVAVLGHRGRPALSGQSLTEVGMNGGIRKSCESFQREYQVLR